MTALALGTSINVAAGHDVTSLLEQTERELWKTRTLNAGSMSPPQSPAPGAGAAGVASPPIIIGMDHQHPRGVMPASASVLNPRDGSDAAQLRAFLAHKILHCDHRESVFGVVLQPGIRSGVISAFASAVIAVGIRLQVFYCKKRARTHADGMRFPGGLFGGMQVAAPNACLLLVTICCRVCVVYRRTCGS